MKKPKKLSSTELAELIVGSLVDAKLLSKDDLDRSVEIVSQEIDARKAVEDY